MVPILAAVALAVTASAGAAFSSPSDLAVPATWSPLDPVRLAADFAPSSPAAPDVEPFEPAAIDSAASPGDSLAVEADSAAVPARSAVPAGPVLPAATVVSQQPSIVAPIVGALVGGALGLFGGGALGVAVTEPDYSDDYEEVAAAVLCATVGEMFLMPAGAHIANEDQGSYWSGLGGSALGVVATIAFSYAGPIGAIAGVALQTTLTVAGVRRSAKRDAAERAAFKEAAEPASR